MANQMCYVIWIANDICLSFCTIFFTLAIQNGWVGSRRQHHHHHHHCHCRVSSSIKRSWGIKFVDWLGGLSLNDTTLRNKMRKKTIYVLLNAPLLAFYKVCTHQYITGILTICYHWCTSTLFVCIELKLRVHCVKSNTTANVSHKTVFNSI